MTPDPLLAVLRGVVGDAHVLVDADARAGFEVDWTGRFRGTARAVVRPGSTAEVAAVLAACSTANAPVVPQGGNTGLVGGGVPRGGEVVLSTQRLDAIEAVGGTDAELVVGAGATLEGVQAVARAQGWDVGVDIASRGSATVGGMVATNAGGEHVLRYGQMERQLVGVEGVLADGSIVGEVPALRKDNTGYHWTGVLAGSEGTLAVITRVHLALVPLLSHRVVALCGLDDLAAAMRLGTALRRELDSLAALEVFFADGLALVREHLGLADPLSVPCSTYLLVECGVHTGGDGLLDAVGTAVTASAEVRASAVAEDSVGRARLWKYREGHTEAISAVGIPHKLDVTLPFDQLAAFEPAVRARIHEVDPSAVPVLFGHVGDGNLHVNVLGLEPDDDRVDRAVLELVASMGGSISAEHGIGVAKRDELGLSRAPADIAAMRAIKRALDPEGVLNPGVLFAPQDAPRKGDSRRSSLQGQQSTRGRSSAG